MDLLRKTWTKIADWTRDEDGTATIEAVLWIPIYAGLLTFIADVSLVFHNQAQVMRIIQDGNRRLSVGLIQGATITEVEVATQTYIESELAAFAPNATASTTIDNNIIYTSVSVPASDLDSVGLWTSLNDINLLVTAQQLWEYRG